MTLTLIMLTLVATILSAAAQRWMRGLASARDLAARVAAEAASSGK